MAYDVILATVGDPARTRTLYALVLLLVAIGLTLILLALWLWRRTRPDPALLGPLEAMGEGDYADADPDVRRSLLDDVRPADARPLDDEAVDELVLVDAVVDAEVLAPPGPSEVVMAATTGRGDEPQPATARDPVLAEVSDAADDEGVDVDSVDLASVPDGAGADIDFEEVDRMLGLAPEPKVSPVPPAEPIDVEIELPPPPPPPAAAAADVVDADAADDAQRSGSAPN